MGPLSRAIDVTDVRQVFIEHFGSGAINIVTGQENRVHGELQAPEDFLDRVEIRQFDDQLRIAMPHGLLNSPNAYLDLTAPDGLSYTISTGSADIRIGADSDRSWIASGSGEVLLSTATDLTVNSGSGSITVGTLTGRAATIGTASGDIRVDRADVPIQAKTASGNVRINRLRGDLRASSASGDISVSASTASADLRTASGALEVGVAEDLPVWLDLSSASGRIDIGLDAGQAAAEGEPYVSIRARSASGAISVFRA